MQLQCRAIIRRLSADIFYFLSNYLCIIENGINIIKVYFFPLLKIWRLVPFLKPIIFQNFWNCYALYTKHNTASESQANKRDKMRKLNYKQKTIITSDILTLTVRGFGSKIRLSSFLAPEENQEGKKKSAFMICIQIY